MRLLLELLFLALLLELRLEIILVRISSVLEINVLLELVALLILLVIRLLVASLLVRLLLIERRPSLEFLWLVALRDVKVGNRLVLGFNIKFDPCLLGSFWRRRKILFVLTLRTMLVQKDWGGMRPALFDAQRRLFVLIQR